MTWSSSVTGRITSVLLENPCPYPSEESFMLDPTKHFLMPRHDCAERSSTGMRLSYTHLAQAEAGGGACLGLQDAQVLGLALQDLQALWGVRRRDHDLVEHAGLVVSGAAELADLPGKLCDETQAHAFRSVSALNFIACLHHATQSS
eukprot:scaffold133995_cov18-Tisochrysis_lutea.AAC.1